MDDLSMWNGAMSRFASIWFPAWRLERLKRADPCAIPRKSKLDAHSRSPTCELPFALVERGAHGLELVAVNSAAEAEGVHAGFSLSDARVVIPSLLTLPAERERDLEVLRALALWLGRYGPHRNLEGEDGIWIELTGVAHLFGGEQKLVEDMGRRLARIGFTARIGVADTSAAAFAMARFGASANKPFARARVGATKDAMAGFPVEALQVDPVASGLLKRLGIRRIGQLYDVPREPLAHRFRESARNGSHRLQRDALARGRLRRDVRPERAHRLAGEVLSRLDRALGSSPEALVSIEEAPAYVARRAFAEPLMYAEAIESAVKEIAFELCLRLECAHRAASRFDLCLYRADGTAFHVLVGLSQPGRAASHLWDLLSTRLAAFDAGFGIDALSLEAAGVESLAAFQLQMASGAPTQGDPAALVDRLSARLGKNRVLRLMPADSHCPERAEERVPAFSAQSRLDRIGENDPLAKALRPAFLFPRPAPIAVMAEVPEGPPLHFTWRRLMRRIMRASGPERIESDWWLYPGREPSGTDRVRDYYTIEDESGARYWVFRAGGYGQHAEYQPSWFLHGVF